MAPTNTAALLASAKANPLEVGPVDVPTAGPDEIIVKVAAIAINPMDWMIQSMGNDLFPFLQYPYVGGTDASGTIHEVGSDVKGFAVGDRVLTFSVGFTSREGTFQEYVAAKAIMTAKIPASVDFASAAVLPMGLAAAAGALYEPQCLELAYPSVKPTSTGKTVLIWAGASSVGSTAVQLAVASGYEVITTASPKNFDYCKSQGAAQVFDYHSATVVDDIAKALEGKDVVGGFSIHPEALAPVYEIIAQTKGDRIVVVAQPNPDTSAAPKALARVKGIFAGSIQQNDVAGIIFHKFVPEALAAGTFQCTPPPLVVGNGLQSVQEALDKVKSGEVSAQKIVVVL